MLYPENIEEKIGFDEVRSTLRSLCLSPLGRERVDQMTFLTNPAAVRALHEQVAQFQQILDEQTEQAPQDFFDLRPSIHRIRLEGTHLEEQEIATLQRSLTTLHTWVELLRQEDDDHPRFPALVLMAQGVFTFHAVSRRIEQLLDKYGRIKDDATPQLATIRRELRRSEGSVSNALNRILKAAQAEGLVDKDTAPTLRDGRLVIPVAPAMKRRLRGIVHDESATGKTVFIEPEEVVEANNHIRELEAEEKRELIRILREFTETLRPNIKELLRAFEFLADIEFLIVKTRYTQQTAAVSPTIADTPALDWTLARHPLLERTLKSQGKAVIPLDITLTPRQHILLISGPNAGGKSVCLKTVGLLQYMLQCGLPVPMGPHSRCGIFQSILIDIGDEQSIDDDLSTYSGHLRNMKTMMRQASPDSLLLIDEFGSGTEPTIGGAIAQAILSRFAQSHTFAVITTHYQNLKHYADETPGLVNGAMLYDRHRMEALFRLQIGQPGSSFALEIARKTGIPEDVIRQATDLVGQDYVDADKYLLDITRDKRYWEGKRQTIHDREKHLEDTIRKYEQDVAQLQTQRREIIREARQQAQQIISDSNALVEKTIREIREAQAEKEKTKNIRQQVDDFRQQLEASQREHDALIEKKMRQIEARHQRQEQNKARRAKKKTSTATPAEQAAQPTVGIGSHVRLKGQHTVGQVQALRGKQATVAFGTILTTVDIERLEPATKPEQQQQFSVSYVSTDAHSHMRERNLHFKPEIDVRGMRGDEALQTVTHYIDDAVLLGTARVRILHGTGNGILRQLIRQYLQTIPEVTAAHDEHVQFGGAGITVVEFG